MPFDAFWCTLTQTKCSSVSILHLVRINVYQSLQHLICILLRPLKLWTFSINLKLKKIWNVLFRLNITERSVKLLLGAMQWIGFWHLRPDSSVSESLSSRNKAWQPKCFEKSPAGGLFLWNKIWNLGWFGWVNYEKGQK